MFKVIEKDLTTFSTIRTGSYCKYYAEINSSEDIKSAIDFKNKNNLKFKILGNGSNILFSKDYYDDILFLKFGDGFNFITYYDDYVEIGSSYSLIQAGRELISKGYQSFIFFSLIPASIGGAIRQNAGTGSNEEIKDVCLSCKVYDIGKNEEIEFDLDNMNFSYRNSIIKKNPNRYIVLSSRFKLNNQTDNIDELILKMKDRVKEKKMREPSGYSFGSTFVNDQKKAWEYVDSIYNNLDLSDDYYFSDKHKNWVVNRNGSGKDILDLIDKVKIEVKKKFNVNLKLEIDII
tara:strand:- start:1830 stop:2699 length:870 start_codon:yes stop_codon:yes gene_type:complete